MGENLAMKKPIRRMATLFLMPAVLMYAFLFVYPSARAFYISLFDWNGFTSSMKFIGLDNFKELFGDSAFWTVAAKNSLLITFVGGALIFAVAFLLCAVLSTNIKGKKFFRALIFFPSVISPVAVAILWTFIYNQNWGLLNNFLSIFGIEAVTWMAPETLIWAIMAALVWMNSGFYATLCLCYQRSMCCTERPRYSRADRYVLSIPRKGSPTLLSDTGAGYAASAQPSVV